MACDAAAILAKAEESRLRSINVDDFNPEALATKTAKLPEKVRRSRIISLAFFFLPRFRGLFLPLFIIVMLQCKDAVQ